MYSFVQKTNENQPVRFITLVAPYEKETPDIKVELVGHQHAGSKYLQLKLYKNGKEGVLSYSLLNYS